MLGRRDQITSGYESEWKFHLLGETEAAENTDVLTGLVYKLTHRHSLWAPAKGQWLVGGGEKKKRKGALGRGECTRVILGEAEL